MINLYKIIFHQSVGSEEAGTLASHVRFFSLEITKRLLLLGPVAQVVRAHA